MAVVVTFNRLAQLKVTLPRLLSSAEEHLHKVVVIDNASSDGTREWLASLPNSHLLVVHCATNIGGAGGFETGMRIANEQFDPDWILVMDDDARPQPEALDIFHAYDRSEAEAWAAAVYHPDGRICDMNRPSVNPFWHPAVLRRTLVGGGRNGFHIGASEYAASSSTPIDGASFVGLFVSRAAIARVGFPDGRLFIYGDDVLYTLGLRQAGGEIRFDPALCFEHDFSTIAQDTYRIAPLWKVYYHTRNLVMVYRLAAGWLFWPILPLITLKWLLKLRHYNGARWRYLALLARALRDGLLGRTRVTHTRVREWAGEGTRASTTIEDVAVVTPHQHHSQEKTN